MSSISNNPQQMPNVDASNLPVPADAHQRKLADGEQVLPKGAPGAKAGTAEAHEQVSAKTADLATVRGADSFGVGQAAAAEIPADAAGSMPTLPTHNVSAGDIKEAGAATKHLPSGSQIQITGSIADAMRILTESTNKNYDAQSKARVAAGKASLNAQAASAQEAQNKASAEQKAAIVSLAGNILGTATSFGMAKRGTSHIPHAGHDELPGAAGSNAASVAAKTEAHKTQASDDFAEMSAKRRQRREASTDDYESEMSSEDRASLRNDHTAEKRNNKKEGVEEKASPVDSPVPEQKKFNGTEISHSAKTSEQLEADSKAQSNSSASYAAASSASQLVSSIFSAADQNVGYAHEASQAEIRGKLDDMQKGIADQLLESAKANHEKASKSIDSANDLLKQHFDMVKSTNDRIGQ